MKITSLGNGGAFATMDEGNSSFLIEHNNKKLLFDCGTTTPYILRDEFKIPFTDIDAVYISHIHGDHMGGLEMLAHSRYYIPKTDENGKRIRPKLFGHPDVMDELDTALMHGLEAFYDGRGITVDDYFDRDAMPNYKSFVWQGIRFQYQFSRHMPLFKQQAGSMYDDQFKSNYGLWFVSDNGNRVLFTSDCMEPHDLCEQSDIVIHDAKNHGKVVGGNHCHFSELTKHWRNKKLKTDLFLTHYGKPWSLETGLEGIDPDVDIKFFAKTLNLIV
jgi:ribonuclease BN (tRNA processing enzyme)